MPERDWAKDWELCEKAKYTNVQDRNGTLTSFMQVPALNAYHMQLMREALEALPYWLQRVRELEEALMAMFGTTDVKKARSDLGGILCRLEETEKYADELSSKLQRVRKLEAENTSLREQLELTQTEVKSYHTLCEGYFAELKRKDTKLEEVTKKVRELEVRLAKTEVRLKFSSEQVEKLEAVAREAKKVVGIMQSDECDRKKLFAAVTWLDAALAELEEGENCG